VRGGRDDQPATDRPRGMWSYLAVTGGIEVPPVLGSRFDISERTFLADAWQAPCEAGDVLRIGNVKLR